MGDKIKKVMGKRFSTFLLITLLVIIYWRWFLPGPGVANDLPSVSDSLLKSFMDLPWVWLEKPSEGLGEYTIFTLWSYPLNFLSGVLANIGLGFVIQERMLFLIPFLLFGAGGFWRLCGKLNISSNAKLISTLFYLANTYILLLIDGGQFNVALAYSFFPISFVALEQSIKGSLKSKILAGLIVSILGFFDIRFIYVLFLLIFLRFLYQPTNILSWIKSGLSITLILMGLNAYWLLPYLKVPLPETALAFLTKASFISFTNLGHGVLLLQPHWHKNVFGQITPLRWEFVLIPIFVFLAPILNRKNKEVGFWLLVALISIFLVKGASEPITWVYPWLYHNVVGFSLFRDPSKFFFLVALSYSVLLAISLDVMIKRLAQLPKIRFLFITLVIFYLFFLIRPIWLGQMTGTFSQPPFKKEYSQLAQILAQDQKFSRVFWIPTIAPLTWQTLEHPSLEASRLVQKRPFAIGTKGSYEIFNFLREAPYMGEIFNVSGIGYIAYPYLDKRRDDLHPDNIRYYYTFSDQLSDLSWLMKMESSPIHLWQTRQHQDRFFITPNIWWVIGSDNIYNESTKSANLKLSNNALVFVEESPGLGGRIDEIPQAKVLLNNKTPIDFAASFVDEDHLIFPARQLDFDPDTSGWWKREAADLIRWRDFLQTKYGIDNLDFDLGGGWAVAEGSLKLKVQSEKFVKDKVILARVFESARSGQLKFYQEDLLIGGVTTKKEDDVTNIRWFEIGQLITNGELTIESTGDINVVNALAILDRQEWVVFQNKAKGMENKIVAFDEENIQQMNATVTYQQLNPTQYKVKIQDLTTPTFLVFSQTYDSLWKINGQSALPVYSLLNGFRIDKDGEYTVEFKVQKYVYPGLVISFSILALTAYLLLFHKHKQPSI